MKRDSKPEVICVACKEQFEFNNQLIYHIRKQHFNRVSVVPYCETQSVNRVWFEKVGHTNVLVEIKKMSDNMLLIQKLKDNTTIQPTEMNLETIDLRKQYPLLGAGYKRNTEQCRVCHKTCDKRHLGKHFKQCHPRLATKRCGTCKIQFKSLIKRAMHICPTSINKKKLKMKNEKWTVVD